MEDNQLDIGKDSLIAMWPKLLNVFGITDYATACGEMGDYETSYMRAMSIMRDMRPDVSFPDWDTRTDVFTNNITKAEFNNVLGVKDYLQNEMSLRMFYDSGVLHPDDGIMFKFLAKIITGNDYATEFNPYDQLEKNVACLGGDPMDLFNLMKDQNNSITIGKNDDYILTGIAGVTDASSTLDEDDVRVLDTCVNVDSAIAIDTTVADGKFVFDLGNTHPVENLKLYSVSATRNYADIYSIQSRLGIEDITAACRKAKAALGTDLTKQDPDAKNQLNRLICLRNAFIDVKYTYNLMTRTGIVGVRTTFSDAKLPKDHEWVFLLGALTLGNWSGLYKKVVGSSK